MSAAVSALRPSPPGRMATTQRQVNAPVEDVATILSDPRSYDGIVVGSRRIRWFDARWPAPATALHHTIGFGPLTLRDTTTVLRDDLPDELELAAGVRPAGVLRVVFRLSPEGSGTLVVMEEGPMEGPLALMWSPLLALVTAKRNDWALARLAHLAAERTRVRRLGDHQPAEGRGRSRSAGHRPGQPSHRRPPKGPGGPAIRPAGGPERGRG